MFTQDVPSEDEIGQYYRSDNYISHTNTSEGIVNTLYHHVRKITLEQKRKLLAKITKKNTGTLLDIGAGTGSFASHMKSAGWNVTALEPDSHARQVAFQANNIHLLPSEDLFKLNASTYDVITMWHVLEHVHRLHEYIDQCKKLLLPNGKLVVAVPNFTSKDALHYQQYWAAYDVPRHLYHFSPEAMKQLMSRHGLSIRRIKPMWFDSFYVSMLSEQYRSGRSNLPGALAQGLSSNLGALTKRKTASSLIYIIEA